MGLEGDRGFVGLTDGLRISLMSTEAERGSGLERDCLILKRTKEKRSEIKCQIEKRGNGAFMCGSGHREVTGGGHEVISFIGILAVKWTQMKWAYPLRFL